MYPNDDSTRIFRSRNPSNSSNDSSHYNSGFKSSMANYTFPKD